MITKNKIKNIIGALCLAILGSSCNSFLDVTPNELTPKTFYKTESDLKSALLGAYAPLNFEQFYGNFYPTVLAGGDDLTFYQRNNPANPPTSIIMANANRSSAEIATFWKALYEGINRANVLIENVDNNKEITEALRKQVRAEATFLRAFYHFHLVQAWGDVPLILESLKQIDYSMFRARTPKNVVYNQICSDIAEAIPHLPELTELGHTGTISKTAAKGILARIYLFRAGEHHRDGVAEPAEVKSYYEEVKRLTLEIKESGLHSLAPSYSQVFIDYAADKYNSQGALESMWEAEFAGNREGEVQAAGRIGNTIGFGALNDYSQVDGVREETGMKNPGMSYRFLYASLKLYRMYEEDGDRERGDWNIAPFEYTVDKQTKGIVGRTYYFGKKPSGLSEVEGMPCVELDENDQKGFPDNKFKTRCVAKYRREYEQVIPKAKNHTPINFPILRYSDVLLMLAEAENYLNGPTGVAYEAINAVRQRAKIKDLPQGLSKEAFLAALKKERAMELCFEAGRRWDLIRWGDFYNSMQGMKHYVSDGEWNPRHDYALEYYNVSPAYVYFPIPDLEIGANPLPQNPGW